MNGNFGKIRIAPSLMCADLMDLRHETQLLAEGGIDLLHIDIMDGHYVPNFTLGADVCRMLATRSPIALDIHLMIEDVDRYLPDFCLCPGTIVTFHPEVSYHPLRTLQTIRRHHCRAGIAIDPALSLEGIRPLLDYADLVCVMTVNPGYSGQDLIPECLGKLAQLRDEIRRRALPVVLEVDGNVSWGNIPSMIECGAEILVCGSSSLFDCNGLPGNLEKLRRLCDPAAARCGA
ncbi:MAG: ribulose-phosphate 3-epimerase [Victivallaceae bacterium]|nr:ribulose-phosphate 3-epimerase [Victivallaceae bacterium]